MAVTANKTEYPTIELAMERISNFTKQHGRGPSGLRVGKKTYQNLCREAKVYATYPVQGIPIVTELDGIPIYIDEKVDIMLACVGFTRGSKPAIEVV